MLQLYSLMLIWIHRLHRLLAEMPSVSVNDRAESVLGQDNLGSSVGLRNGSIPVCSQAAQT